MYYYFLLRYKFWWYKLCLVKWIMDILIYSCFFGMLVIVISLLFGFFVCKIMWFVGVFDFIVVFVLLFVKF